MGLLKKDDLSDIEMHFEDYVSEDRKSDKSLCVMFGTVRFEKYGKRLFRNEG